MGFKTQQRVKIYDNDFESSQNLCQTAGVSKKQDLCLIDSIYLNSVDEGKTYWKCVIATCYHEWDSRTQDHHMQVKQLVQGENRTVPTRLS